MRKNEITVAAYYFPNFHIDPKNEIVHGKGWTEWEVAKCARPRFNGHQQPKVPLWGYEDEADPKVMAKKITAAKTHGIDTFIFDWYYSEEGSFRERALNDGFLKATNTDDMKYALMWCNHDRQGLHPAPYTMNVELFSRAGVTPATFEKMTTHIVEDYFTRPNYWKIDGKPYFSIYVISNMIRDFGGIEACAAALERFRAKAIAAGFPGIYLHVNFHDFKKVIDQLEGREEIKPDSPLLSWYGRTSVELVAALKIDACGPYSWWESGFFSGFPTVDADAVRKNNFAFWNHEATEYVVPYHPVISMGWDSSPRTVQSDMYEPRGYPFSGVWRQSPDHFKSALEEVRRFLETRPLRERVVTLCAWNEWTEGAYLEPDAITGYGYLEAVRDVFGLHQTQGR